MEKLKDPYSSTSTLNIDGDYKMQKKKNLQWLN